MGNNTQKSPKSQVKLPEGSRVMPREQQRRMAQATQERRERNTYNMKVVIRGDSGTGKTTLLRRLEGRKFVAAHTASSQLQTTSIIWNYNASDESAKIELWDVVDKGEKRVDPEGNEIAVADATTVDVYGGAHAVLFLVDPCKKWTLDYVIEKIPEVPKKMEILVLFSFRDLEDRHVLTEKEIYSFIEQQPDNVRMLEVSLKNCFGFKELHKFFNLPFLRMKHRMLQEHLKRTEEEIANSLTEVNTLFEFSDYSKFLQQLADAASRKKTTEKLGTRLKQTITSSTELFKRQMSSKKKNGASSPRSMSDSEKEPKEKAKGVSKKVSSEQPKKVASKPKPVASAPQKKKPNKLESIDDFEVGQIDDSFFGGMESDPEESEEFDLVEPPETEIPTAPVVTHVEAKPEVVEIDEDEDEESEPFEDPDEDEEQDKGNTGRKSSMQMMGYATELSDEESDSDEFEDAFEAPVRFQKEEKKKPAEVEAAEEAVEEPVKIEEDEQEEEIEAENDEPSVEAPPEEAQNELEETPSEPEQVEVKEVEPVKVEEKRDEPVDSEKPPLESGKAAMENFLADVSEEDESEDVDEVEPDEPEVQEVPEQTSEPMRPMAMTQTMSYEEESEEESDEDEPEEPPNRPKMMTIQKLSSFQEDESESDDFDDVLIPVPVARKVSSSTKAQPKKSEDPAPIFKSLSTPKTSPTIDIPKKSLEIDLPKDPASPELKGDVMSATDILSITPTTPDKKEDDFKNKSQLNSMFGMTKDVSSEVNSEALLQFMKDVEKEKRGDVKKEKKKTKDKRAPEKKKRSKRKKKPKKKKEKESKSKKKKKRTPKTEVQKKQQSEDEDDSLGDLF